MEREIAYFNLLLEEREILDKVIYAKPKDKHRYDYKLSQIRTIKEMLKIEREIEAKRRYISNYEIHKKNNR